MWFLNSKKKCLKQKFKKPNVGKRNNSTFTNLRTQSFIYEKIQKKTVTLESRDFSTPSENRKSFKPSNYFDTNNRLTWWPNA